MPTAQSIFNEMDAHIKKSGIAYSKWYVGITGDLDERLFGYHQVPRKNHWRSTREADNHRDARAVERGFHERGCKGAGGGGDHTAIFVYAYLITPETVE